MKKTGDIKYIKVKKTCCKDKNQVTFNKVTQRIKVGQQQEIYFDPEDSE